MQTKLIPFKLCIIYDFTVSFVISSVQVEKLGFRQLEYCANLLRYFNANYLLIELITSL